MGDAAEVFRHVDGKNEKALGEVSAFWLADEHTPKPVNGVAPVLTTEEKRHHFINQVRCSRLSMIAGMLINPCPCVQPPLVFLGVDERSAPESAKSLPLSKPDDNSSLASHSPYGVPYWALDCSSLESLKSKFLKTGDKFEFVDMRAGMASIPGEEAAIGAEGRALVDWNKRNVVSRRLAGELHEGR